jgi:hypothetical protein
VNDPLILYDHEEEIIAASVQKNLLASMDTNGTVLVRDLNNNQNTIISYNASKGGSMACETGFLLFNVQFANEIFVFFNNELEVFDGKGQCLQNYVFEDNVQCAIQDEDSLIVAFQNGGIACYNWNQDKISDSLKGIGPVKSFAISDPVKVSKPEKILVCGCESGELIIIRNAK